MRKLIPLFTFACALAMSAPAAAQPPGEQQGPVAQIIVYDVAPEAQQQFKEALASTRVAYQREPGFINERVLDSLDTLALKYATYARFSNAVAAENMLKRRLDAVAPYVRRAPEVHTAVLTQAFTPQAINRKPKGNEFAEGKVNQVAHLGMFIPFPKYWEQYEKALDDVKTVTRGRKPAGFLGDDVLVETTAPAPERQTPYSPRAAEASRMSFNYGEYNTLEDAENSYVRRHGPVEDPKIAALARVFYGSLQVPARFYIFRVVDNYGPSSANVRQGRSKPR
ncbi:MULTISPECIES: hypothetical protein [Corallococcus]|uniref:hypothetical protein n=1 Tax=Corallococcus TaxID=83461 RepID=UPI00117C9506|nr:MULTISPECIES: hypothetical protein [Corallococcus]NBD07537.1 hypothetical protein [Corallococcus silvisoli]TSC33543.1 hypothetical protein FOF48_00355 [Corallococcus sp. Z5C101001]